MAQIICYEVFPTEKNINRMRRVLVNKHGFCEKKNQHGSYFYIEVSSLDSWQIATILKVHKYKHRCFDKRYERGSNYRNTFFETHKGPYRCAYCGRHIKGKDLEVDHLIPISQAKSKFSVRTWLQLCGIMDVNDHRNLVASCKKCNRRKSDKMGIWIFKGILGRHKLFWIMRDCIVLIVIVIIINVLCSAYPIIEFLQNFISNII